MLWGGQLWGGGPASPACAAPRCGRPCRRVSWEPGPPTLLCPRRARCACQARMLLSELVREISQKVNLILSRSLSQPGEAGSHSHPSPSDSVILAGVPLGGSCLRFSPGPEVTPAHVFKKNALRRGEEAARSAGFRALASVLCHVAQRGSVTWPSPGRLNRAFGQILLKGIPLHLGGRRGSQRPS